MFKIINRLYGIEMKKLEINSYSEDVEIYEVSKN
jgi:Zn-dependent oligopeptidase